MTNPTDPRDWPHPYCPHGVSPPHMCAKCPPPKDGPRIVCNSCGETPTDIRRHVCAKRRDDYLDIDSFTPEERKRIETIGAALLPRRKPEPAKPSRPYTGCMRHMWPDDGDEMCPICADENEKRKPNYRSDIPPVPMKDGVAIEPAQAEARKFEDTGMVCDNCGSFEHIDYYCPEPAKREARVLDLWSISHTSNGSSVRGPYIAEYTRVDVVRAERLEQAERERDELKADYERWTAYAKKWKSVSEIIASNDQLQRELSEVTERKHLLENTVLRLGKDLEAAKAERIKQAQFERMRDTIFENEERAHREERDALRAEVERLKHMMSRDDQAIADHFNRAIENGKLANEYREKLALAREGLRRVEAFDGTSIDEVCAIARETLEKMGEANETK